MCGVLVGVIGCGWDVAIVVERVWRGLSGVGSVWVSEGKVRLVSFCGACDGWVCVVAIVAGMRWTGLLLVAILWVAMDMVQW